jgi:hypothetical protein
VQAKRQERLRVVPATGPKIGKGHGTPKYLLSGLLTCSCGALRSRQTVSARGFFDFVLGPGDEVPVVGLTDTGPLRTMLPVASDQMMLESSNPSVLRIAGARVIGVSPGEADIRATFQSLSANAHARVSPPPAVARLVLGANRLISCLSPGQTTIEVTYQGKTASAQITVRAPQSAFAAPSHTRGIALSLLLRGVRIAPRGSSPRGCAVSLFMVVGWARRRDVDARPSLFWDSPGDCRSGADSFEPCWQAI